MADLKISALTGSTTPLAGTEVLPIVQSSATVKVSVDNLIAGRALPNLGIGVAPSSWGASQKAIEYGVVGAGISVNSANGNMNVASNQYNNGTSTLYASTNPNFLVQFSRSAGALNLYTAPSGTGGTAITSTLRYQFGNTGDFTLNTGNLVIGTSGQGIDFSATPGTGTSELLADYEEGTWTPALTSAGGNFTTIAYGDQQGFYTKVGRQVTVYGFLFTSGAITAGSASGQVYVSGLPFAVVTAGIGTVWTNPDTANYNSPLALATGVTASSSTLRLFKAGLVNNTAFAVTDLRTAGGPSNYIFFQSTYFV
jgi:hypothetical protein